MLVSVKHRSLQGVEKTTNNFNEMFSVLYLYLKLLKKVIIVQMVTQLISNKKLNTWIKKLMTLCQPGYAYWKETWDCYRQLKAFHFCQKHFV